MKTDRIDWLDVSRGIVIILMVFGHSAIPQTINNWIYSFHMPFFFFISGMLIKQKTYTDIKDFCKELYQYTGRKATSLLLPFVIYSLVNILLYPLYGNKEMLAFGKGVLQNGWGAYALWFIPVFFVANIICKISVISRTTTYSALFLMLITGASFDHYNIFLPWNMSSVPFACLYILSGYLLKECILKAKNTKKTHTIISTILCCVIPFIISQYYRLDMCNNKVLPLLPLLLAAILGILFIINLSKFISKKSPISSILQYTGRHTFEILAFGQAIILIINANFKINFAFKYILLFIFIYFICKTKDIIKKIKPII